MSGLPGGQRSHGVTEGMAAPAMTEPNGKEKRSSLEAVLPEEVMDPGSIRSRVS